MKLAEMNIFNFFRTSVEVKLEKGETCKTEIKNPFFSVNFFANVTTTKWPSYLWNEKNEELLSKLFSLKEIIIRLTK